MAQVIVMKLPVPGSHIWAAAGQWIPGQAADKIFLKLINARDAIKRMPAHRLPKIRFIALKYNRGF